MAPLLKELSSLEVEPLQIAEKAPDREGFDTPEQESNLESISAASGPFEVEALLTGTVPVDANCCCCGVCCCCCVCCAC